MGQRNARFQVERVARKNAKKKRDQKKLKRTTKGPSVGETLHLKMHAK